MTRVSRTRRKRAKARKTRIEARKGLQGHRKWQLPANLMRAWRAAQLIWKLVGGALLVLSAGSAIYFYVWRLSVTPGVTLKDSDPFKTMFVLQNDGQFPVYDVKFSCTTNSVEYPRDIRVASHYVQSETFDIPKLGANAKTSTPCLFATTVYVPAITADISLTVKYRPSFYPFHKTQHFRFLASRKDDGTYAWTPIAK